MPADTTAPTWLIDFRARQPTPTRPLKWDDYRTVEVAASTRNEALAIWRSNYGGPGREVVSVREGSAIGPRWIASIARVA